MDKKTRYYIPYEMTRKEAVQNGIDPKEVRRIRMGARETVGILIEVSKEVHDEHVRFIFAEEQRSYRASKCIVKSEKTGRLIRCEGKCSECKRKPDGAPLSVDKMLDDNAIEVMASHESESDDILTDALVDSLATKLWTMDPLLAEIFLRVNDLQTQQEIADDLGITKREVQSRVAAYRSILQQQVTREEIMDRKYHTKNSGKKHVSKNN